jgi:ABC-type polysaccharide/polyol phosphate transport system ATPase subunit
MARVVLNDVHVDFPIYGTQNLSLRNAIYQRATGGVIKRDGERSDRVVVKALNGISMHLEEGDRLGLVGHNGSGKSTLLKAIAGIYEPNQGSLLVEGRVTPLFDMMPGLDVEDSGYENLFTAGLLLGMSRDYIESKIPEIEEFCELGEYLSLPVRTYSAGMMTRLGYALVTSLDPDILLMDEGFGAADLRFAERSAERMDEFIGRSRIMVLASHSDSMVASICNKVAWLQEGMLVAIGPVDEIFGKYHDSVRAKAKRKKPEIKEVGEIATLSEPVKPVYREASIRNIGLADRRERTSGDAVLTKLVATDPAGSVRWEFQQNETVTFHIEYEVIKSIPNLLLLFRLNLAEDPAAGRPLQVIGEIKEVLSGRPINKGTRHAVKLTLSSLGYLRNRFSLYVCLGPTTGNKFFDVVDSNVALPELVIREEPAKQPRTGVVALDYTIDTAGEEPEAVLVSNLAPNFRERS